MTDPKESYRKRHAEACAKCFEGFSPDVTRCRNPGFVLQVRDMAASGLYSKEIAERLGTTPKAIQKIFRRYNFPSLHNITVPKLEERYDWKHGQKMMKGYIYQRCPGHPHGTKHGCYVALHRLVIEEKIGRYLLPSEVVDHIDGNILNNHPDNLRVFASNADHLSATLKGKCPEWSEEGKRRIVEAVKARHRRDKAQKASSNQ